MWFHQVSYIPAIPNQLDYRRQIFVHILPWKCYPIVKTTFDQSAAQAPHQPPAKQ